LKNILDFYLLLKYINSFKIKNYDRFSSSDVILFKFFKPSAMALAPSSEILLLDKKFLFFYLLFKYINIYEIKNFYKFSLSIVILFKLVNPS